MSGTAVQILDQYNLITIGNATTGSDVEGSAIIGGNLNGATFFNKNVPSSPHIYLYGAQNGNLNLDAHGTLYLAGSKNGTVSGGTVAGAPPATLASFINPLTALSTQLATLAADTSTVTVGENSTTFTAFAESNGMAVFNITLAALNTAMANTTIYFVIGAGVTGVVVNVIGAGTFTDTSNWNDSPLRDVLFNFENATTVNVGNWQASILAPDAAVQITNGAINGSLFANSFTGGGELHNDTFDGVLTCCFLAGTNIGTPHGETYVEDIRIGDLVLAVDGRALPVRWIGKKSISTMFADPLLIMPIRIRAGALDDNVPTRDLLVSPDHAMFVDGTLIQAGALVNGVSVVREANMPTSFIYYHVELEDHSLILAEGAATETFVDNVDRMAFDNWAEHLALFGEDNIAEMDYPRVKSARQMPCAIRQRLAALQSRFAVERRHVA